MILNNKYIIGTNIMFYEIEIASEFVQSLIDGVKPIENKENITVDLFYNISEYFEEINTEEISKEELIEKFMILVQNMKNTGCNVTYKIYDEFKPYSMVDYRRDLNYHNCRDYDYIIWGESDCLFPLEFYNALESIKNYATENNIHRYVTTFAIRKMWDDTWKDLEHSDFTNLPYYPLDGTNPEAFTEPHQCRYTMNIDEMNDINAKAKDEFDIRIIRKPQFDGSGLILSSDLIQNGVNIPHCIIGHAVDDTSMMYSCEKMLGESYVQFIVKNILKVHNRIHPRKRMYIKGEDSNLTLEDNKKDINTLVSLRREKNDWYNKLKNLCHFNIAKYGKYQDRFFTYKDFHKKFKI